MKKILILSHAFNMDGRAASQTITDKVPYFLDAGYELYVLSAVTGQKDTSVHHKQLLAWGPSAFRFDFRHWFAMRYGRNAAYKLITGILSILLLPFIFLEKLLLGLSNQWSWTFPAVINGYWLIKTKKINLVYSTGGAWSAHLAGWILKKITRAMLIVEIHDPLVIQDISTSSSWSKKLWSRENEFQKILESLLCKDADLVWWFTEGALSLARKRNPELGSRGFYLLPGVQAPEIRINHSFKPFFSIGHFGSLADSRSLEPILNVLPKFFEKHPEAKNLLKINIYGSGLDKKSNSIIQRLSLQSSIVSHGRLEYDPVTGLSGRQRIIQEMQASDVLLLLHGSHEGCYEYIPSKIYEYWWADRPILACTHLNRQLDELIKKINGPTNDLYLSHVDDEDEVYKSIEFAWFNWLDKKEFLRQHEPLGVKTAVEQIIQKITHR